jgi:hypothetical protein
MRIIFFLLFILLAASITEAKPLLVYGKDVNITRAKSLMKQLPEKCFDGIDVVYFYNKTSNYAGYFQYNVGGRHNKEVIVYWFNKQTDSQVINIINHELGHYKEYKNGFRVSATQGFNETFAKNFVCKN